MSVRTLQAAAARGATLLDSVHPSWFNEIDIRQLDLSSGFFCIIGQLNDGDYAPESYIGAQIRESVGEKVETELRSAAKKLKIPGFKACEIEFDLDACLDQAVEQGLKGYDDRKYGFDVDAEDMDAAYSTLTEAWVEEIKARRKRR